MPAKTNRKTKSKKKPVKAKKVAGTKKKPLKKIAKKKPVKTKPVKKKAVKTKVVKAKARAPKPVAAKRSSVSKKKVRAKQQPVEPKAFSVRRLGTRSASQSGDLQGLSRVEDTDSESVAELLEEGNTFEAEVVAGVEAADDEGEVRTHEVPEDDVPDEYLED